MQKRIEKNPGNTPVHKIPADYYPSGCENWYIIPEGLDAGKKMFFHDKVYGTGDPFATIVFIHGNPELSYTYRNVIKQINQHAKGTYRIIAVDHIGFGLSDQCSFEMADMHHSENLIQLVRHLDLKNVTLVIHDWGGPIGVGAFIKDPERVANLVVLNTTVFPYPKNGKDVDNFPYPGIFAWSNSPALVPDSLWGIHAAFSILAKPSTKFRLLFGALGYIIRSKLGIPPSEKIELQQTVWQQYSSKANVKTSKRMVLQCLHWGHGNIYIDPTHGEQDTRPFYRYIQNNISKSWGPQGQNIGVRALFGKWDWLFKEELLDQWVTALPQLKNHMQYFDNVSHFSNEMKPKEVAEAIMDVVDLNMTKFSQ